MDEIGHLDGSPEQEKEYLDVLGQSFSPDDPAVARRRFERKLKIIPQLYRPENSLVIRRDNRIACTVQIFERSIRGPAGKTLRMGGIGAVGTPPAYRGQGLAGRLLAHALSVLREQRYDLSFLYTGLVEYYTKCGWTSRPRTYCRFALPWNGAVPGQDESTTVDEARPEDAAAMAKLYRAFNKGKIGPTQRDSEYFRALLANLSCLSSKERIYVARNRGKLVGYAVTTYAQILAELCCREEAVGRRLFSHAAASLEGETALFHDRVVPFLGEIRSSLPSFETFDWPNEMTAETGRGDVAFTAESEFVYYRTDEF